MKILIDPALSVLIKDFTDDQCAELLRCIFEYPERDCNLGVWQYIKKQIQADEQKYKEKCQRVADLRKKRQYLRSNMISNMKSEMKLSVEEVEEENKNINKKNEFKRSERRNVSKPVENSVENMMEFFIDENFSFEKVSEQNKKFPEYLALFPTSVIVNAEMTFKRKRTGQWANIRQIVEWIEKQNLFYKNNQKA